MSAIIRSTDKNPYKTYVNMDVDSILEVAKELGLSVAVEFNGEGEITILTETRSDAEALGDNVQALLDLMPPY